MSAAKIPPPVSIPLPSGNEPRLISAEEFFRRHETDRVELIKGVVEEQPMPDLLHGYVCGKAYWYLQEFCLRYDLGRLMTNDSFIKVRRNPDTVRGADVCFISYDRLPKGPIPSGLLDVIPELVFEVRSPSDSTPKIMAKVDDYLVAGVTAVVVFDPPRHEATVYRANADERHFTAEQDLTVPDVLPGFSVPVARFFS